ncbi:MAG: hypothetical protein AAFV53_01000 [Myxococcota bacterium]
MATTHSLLNVPRYTCESCGHPSHEDGACPRCGHWEMLDRLHHGDQQYIAAREALRQASIDDWLQTIGLETTMALALMVILPLIFALYYALGGWAISVLLVFPAPFLIVGMIGAWIRHWRQGRRWSGEIDD